MGFGLSSLGSLVSSVGGFLGSSGGSALTQTVLNNYFNRKAASKQYNYTKSLIDYENEYNLPVNQRARLEEAGYNPNLALNGVNVQSATGSAPQVKPTQLDLLGAYNLEAQNDLLKAQQDLTAQNASNAKAQNSILWQKELEQRAKTHMAQYTVDYAEQEYKKFRKTGKIPETYYRTGGLLGQFGAGVDRILPY